MTDEVKKCVDIRINFFDEYFTIPEDMQNEVQAFIADITLLGNSCNSATEFEQKFVSEGLSERFNAILPKCIQKPVKMTKEQKKQSRKIAKEILAENKDELVDDALTYVANRGMNDLRDKAIAISREKMIEEGIISQMVTLPSNMFTTVTLPATLWFFDKNKPNTGRFFRSSINKRQRTYLYNRKQPAYNYNGRCSYQKWWYW